MTLFEKEKREYEYFSRNKFVSWGESVTTNDVFPTHNWLLCLQKIIERSSIYKVLELCPRDLFSHTKKRLVGVNKNIAFNK